MNATTPVVILRSGHHGGLGIVRSLGRLGVPVYCVDAARWEPAFSSRYCRGRWILNAESGPATQAIARLLEIAHQLGGRPLLIPTTDDGAIWVAEHAAALAAGYRFPHQHAALVRTLCDKGRMQDLARQSGVPTAQTIVPQSKQDVERFLDTAVFPVVVKATDTDRLRRRAGGTKFILHSPRELLALYARAQDPQEPQAPNLLIQEFIPGDDWMFDGYFDRDSQCLLGVTGKKIRRFPVNTGVTSLGVCLHNATVQETTTRFMQAIGYHGILDIGYRYDRRDGQYKVLDVNPRIGCTFRLFTATDGMDVARALYLNLTGQPVPPAHAAEGRKWLVEDFDLLSVIGSRREGTLKLKDWMNSLRGVQETACFALDDPLPFLLMGLADACEWCRWLRCQLATRQHAPANAIAVPVQEA
jgi:D-aspartate ligase